MSIGLCDIRAIAKLQSPPRIPPDDGVQDPTGLLPQDIQQSRICSTFIAVCQSRLRGRLRTHENVHNQVGTIIIILFSRILICLTPFFFLNLGRHNPFPLYYYVSLSYFMLFQVILC